jgi:hypothetical protein
MTKRNGNHEARKTYKKYHGSIPKEDDGRTYEIHHVDGNWQNNDVSNLVALRIQDHYDVHFAQEDWGACSRIAGRMSKSTEEIAELSRKQMRELVDSGNHLFTNSEWQSNNAQERVKNNTHNLQGERNPCHKMIEEGTWHTLKREDGSSLSSDRVKEGTFHMSKPEYREGMSRIQNEKVSNGTHGWLGESNPVFTQMANGTHALTGKNNPRFDSTIYSFRHDDTEVVEKMTQNEFIKKYNLHNYSGNLSAMIKGKRNIVKGWRIIERE